MKPNTIINILLQKDGEKYSNRGGENKGTSTHGYIDTTTKWCFRKEKPDSNGND